MTASRHCVSSIRRWSGPGIVAVAVLVVAPALVTSVGRAAEPSASPAGPSALASPSPSAPVAVPGPFDPGEASWVQVGGHRDDGSETLYVGTVAGPAHEVITKDSEIRVSGPVGGKVLAWWRNGGSTTFVLADTADGTRRTVLREDAAVGAGASLDPSGAYIYMAPVEREGRVEGLFRVPVDGGERVRLLGGWDGSVSDMTWSLDGRRLAITGLDGTEVEHRILDPRDGGTMEVHRGDGIRVPVGFVGDELVGYLDRGPERSRQYPLLALDVRRDRVRSLVDGGYGTWADVLPAADGSPVLVYDQPDAENHYTLWTTTGSDEPSLLWSSDQNYTDASMGDFGTSALVRTDERGGVESPGFVPVFAHGVAYPWPDGPAWTSDQRLMVDMATGEQTPFEAGELQR